MIRLAVFVALSVAAAAPVQARTVDAVWTEASKRNFAASLRKGGRSPSLPEVRAYDGQGRLLLRLAPAGTSTVGELRRILSGAEPIPGPSLSQTLAGFELRGGGPVPPAIGTPRLFVMDYWATWCAPCKVVSRELDRWMADQPAGSVTLIRAETDFAAAARGE